MIRALAACLLALVVAGAAAQPDPGRSRPHDDDYFGTAVADPFRHLEDLNDAAVAAWMRAQAQQTRTTLDTLPGLAPLRRRLAQLDAAAGASIDNLQRRPGGRLFYERRGVADDQYKLVLREGGRERVLVDPQAMARRTGVPQAVSYAVASNSGRYLAYGLSAGGSEAADLYVIDTRSGRQLMGPVSRADYGEVAWLPDDSGFFFSRLQPMQPDTPSSARYSRVRALFVPLRGHADAAASVFAFDTPGVAMDEHQDAPAVMPIAGTRWAAGIVRHGTDSEISLYVAPLADAAAGRARWRKLVDRSDGVVAFEARDDRLFLLSHRGAPRLQLLETSLLTPDLENARVLVPEGSGVLTGLVRANDALYLRRRDGTASSLLRLPFTAGGSAAEVALPLRGSFEFAGVDAQLPGVWLALQGWTQPLQLWRVSSQAGQGVVVANTGLQAAPRPGVNGDWVVREVLVESHDGAKVPLAIVHRRGLALNGRNPTLLWGYASYGDTEEPWFSARRLAWLERGGVFAVANPRGSGAFGQAWYRAGVQQDKPNSWKDFIATAEFLLREGYASPRTLGIWGGSAGGILVGRAMTERPDLFAAVVCSVGVLDAVRAELSANGAPNIPEFGTHTTEAGFRSLLAMSTYHHIRNGVAYPAVLFTHGINDPRVEVWHSTKAAARLAEASSSGRPVLLRLDYASGHGIGDTKAQVQGEWADVMGFLLWQFGVPAFQPRP